jgi:hypothetical protein
MLVQLTQVYKSGVDKGIAYPTCVSINNCIGNFSPLSSDTLVLSAGDVVKMYVRRCPSRVQGPLLHTCYICAVS